MKELIIENVETLIISIMAFVSFRCLLDWIVYVLKSGPRSAALSKRSWTFGWICTIGLIYYIVNGYSFL